jgi:hypothetical protein
MNANEPRPPDLRGPTDVPEDVRAEADADEKRLQAEAVSDASAVDLPEDVVKELDRDARLGHEEVRQRLSEGRPPADEEPRS